MQRYELEAAIASGVFKGVLGVLTLIFILWLFSPFLIPLAFGAQIYLIQRWKDLLIIFSFIAIIFMVIYGLWSWLKNSSLGRWFENRLSNDSGKPSLTRAVLLIFGVGAAFFFVIFSIVSKGMSREFTTTDAYFFIGSFCFSVTALTLALRPRKGTVKTP